MPLDKDNFFFNNFNVIKNYILTVKMKHKILSKGKNVMVLINYDVYFFCRPTLKIKFEIEHFSEQNKLGIYGEYNLMEIARDIFLRKYQENLNS